MRDYRLQLFAWLTTAGLMLSLVGLTAHAAPGSTDAADCGAKVTTPSV